MHETQNDSESKYICKCIEYNFVFKMILENSIENRKLDEQLILVIGDMFLPSFSATSTTLQFLIQRFHLQPEIYRKCQDEIDKVIGHDRLPRLDDRIK